MQRIRFGLHLDGERGWHPVDALGVSTVGPLGMLQILETQLGLTRAAVSQAERIVQMRECLLAARTGQRFYERSFEADEMGTAATLLSWRDQWYDHGWNGAFAADVSQRLRDLTEIEERARAAVAPAVGQRLADIAAVLQTRRPQIETIELCDPTDAFPLAWRRVLDLLPISDASGRLDSGQAPGATVLKALQAQLGLMLASQPTRAVSWRDDGSLRIMRAESPLAAAQWMAADLRNTPKTDRLFVIEQSGGLVDAAIAAADQSLLGASEPSAFRPALQLLPLALRLVWEPLDFGALLQFLTHPVNPIRGYARVRLAEKMAETPGIGGDDWLQVLRDIEEHYGDAAADVLGEVRFWLESPRYTSMQQVPMAFVAERTERLMRFFQRRMTGDDPQTRAPWAGGYHQAGALRQALQSLVQQGMHTIAPEALDRLVTQATAFGSDNPALRAEASARARVSNPGAVIDGFDDVCWWHLAAVPLARPYPWSPRELAELRDADVALPDMGEVLTRQARDWMRPLLAARERLTLVLPQRGAEVHPIWLVLDSLLEQAEIIEVESLLQPPTVPLGMTPVPHRPLPSQRRWWQLPAGAIDNTNRSASFSSLEQFIFNPYQWVLNYPAKLQSSALFDVPGEFRLFGTLAHRVVERLYRQPEALAWSRERVSSWFEDAVEQIVREEGAVLLMSGRRADLEGFRQRFRRSLLELHEVLQAANVRKVEPEKELIERTPVGELRGIIDLCVERADGRQAIIDLKWAGNGKYRKKLQTQSHLQLAIYARLIESNTSVWPSVSYFILSRPELLTSSDGFFPGVTPVGVSGEATAQLWERVMSSWRWRGAQIAGGAVEVVLEELDDPQDAGLSRPPDDGLTPEVLDSRYNPFLYLAGWSDEA